MGRSIYLSTHLSTKLLQNLFGNTRWFPEQESSDVRVRRIQSVADSCLWAREVQGSVDYYHSGISLDTKVTSSRDVLEFEWWDTRLKKRSRRRGRVVCSLGDGGKGMVSPGKSCSTRYVAKIAKLEAKAQISRPAQSCPNTMSIIYVYSHPKMPNNWVLNDTEKAPPDPLWK